MHIGDQSDQNFWSVSYGADAPTAPLLGTPKWGSSTQCWISLHLTTLKFWPITSAHFCQPFDNYSQIHQQPKPTIIIMIITIIIIYIFIPP